MNGRFRDKNNPPEVQLGAICDEVVKKLWDNPGYGKKGIYESSRPGTHDFSEAMKPYVRILLLEKEMEGLEKYAMGSPIFKKEFFRISNELLEWEGVIAIKENRI